MSWTSSSDLRGQVVRLWDSGRLLQRAAGADGFPLQLSLRKPTSADLAERFEEVRRWIADLSATPFLQIQWKSVRHRTLGSQRVPDRVSIATAADAARLIGRIAELEDYLALLAQSMRPANPS
jgi:hypothetical protein